MNQQLWTNNPYYRANVTLHSRTLSEMSQPLINPMLFQNASNNRFLPTNTVPMNINQPMPMYWPVTQRLPPFRVLKTAIDFNLGRYPRNIPKPPLVLSAASLTGQPLIYQPALVNSQKFIAQQQAMLYGNGVFSSNAQTLRPTTSALNTNLLPAVPQNHQNMSNMPLNSTKDTDNDLMPLSPARFNCSLAGEENSSSVPPVLPIKCQLPMNRRQVKINFDHDGNILKAPTKRKYSESFHRSAKTRTLTDGCLALTSNATDNDNVSQYRFNGSMDDDLGL